MRHKRTIENVLNFEKAGALAGLGNEIFFCYEVHWKKMA